MFLPTYPENCPHIWKNPSPSEENIHFGGEIKSEIVPFFLYGLVTYMTGIFLKKIGQNRSVLPSAVLKRIYTRLCGVATTNQIIKTNTQWSIQRLSSWVTNQEHLYPVQLAQLVTVTLLLLFMLFILLSIRSTLSSLKNQVKRISRLLSVAPSLPTSLHGTMDREKVEFL